MLQMVAICPHPAIIIPEVGKGELAKVYQTVDAMTQLSTDIKKLAPELIIFITPHGAVFQDAITIPGGKKISGTLKQFGSDILIKRNIDEEFRDKLVDAARSIKAMVAEIDHIDAENYGLTLELDHGILVPLYYFAQEGINTPILPINMGLLPYPELYEFGTCLQKVIQDGDKKVVVIVSGDLSHRLTPDAPAGFDPMGKVFDEIVVQSINDRDILRLFNIEPEIINKAGECGLRPLIMGLGTLDGLEIQSKIYSYEGPFGVGYLVAAMTPGKPDARRVLLAKIKNYLANRINKIRQKESWPVKWARENLESYLKTKSLLAIPDNIPTQFKDAKGVFVSIKKDGQLRGCIGTTEPTKASIAEEIQSNVLKAALEDPRFEPIEGDELEYLTYSVDVLDTPEKIKTIEELDPEVFGVIVKNGFRQGLLLPMLEGINNPQEQVAIAKKKAGIELHEEVELERFRVKRYL